MKKILCVGSVTVDILITPADSVPAPGTLRAVQGIAQYVGGCAANAALDLGRLGVPAALACLVGNDPMGEFVRREAVQAGVDVRGVVTGEVQTTVSVVCVSSTGERSFLYYPGSAAAFRAEQIDRSVMQESDIVFVAGAMLLANFDGTPCAAFLREARALGKLTAMDTAWDFDGVWLPKIAAALPELDWFMPSIDEAKRLTGCADWRAAARALQAMGARNIVIKLGAEGVGMLAETGEELLCPACRVQNPVDTTGAGDAFCAGFLAGLAGDEPIVDALALGNAVGRFCVGAVGASSGVRTLDETRAFVHARKMF